MNIQIIILCTDENSPPYEGEIIYKDDEGAICRCWNWRESLRTMLTENTKHAFLCIESVDESRFEEFQKALNYLSEIVSENIGGTSKIAILDINNREIMIN